MTDDSNNDDSDCSDSGNVAVLFNDDLDREVLALRLTGHSIRSIGRALKLRDSEVLRSLDRSLPSLSPDMRIRLYKEDLQRLDDLMVHWYQKAREGSALATTLAIKLMERRSQMLGSDMPARMKIEVVAGGAQQHTESSTKALIRELDRIASERAPALQIVSSEPDPPPKVDP